MSRRPVVKMSPMAKTPATWLITGTSSGIGRALTEAALRRGDQVAALARDPSSLEELGDEHGAALQVLAADVRNREDVERAVAAAVSRFTSLDVVANNAGYGVFGAVEEATDAQARSIFDTNVFGVLNVLRATLPILRRQKRGHIVQGSSYYGRVAHAGVGLVAATKFAVEGLTTALVDEVVPLGIKVTMLEPGPTATAFVRNLVVAGSITDYDGSVRAVQKALGEMTAKDFNQPEQVAAAVCAAVDADVPPTRLVTGSYAVEQIRAALRAQLQELDEWEAVSRAVDHSEASIAGQH